MVKVHGLSPAERRQDHEGVDTRKVPEVWAQSIPLGIVPVILLGIVPVDTTGLDIVQLFCLRFTC